MPKLYEYFGLVIMFYSNDHEPIHVHGKSQGRESKAEIIFQKGKLSKIRVLTVRGKRPLNSTEMQNFKNLVQSKGLEIRQKWIEFFVDNQPIACEKITRKLK